MHYVIQVIVLPTVMHIRYKIKFLSYITDVVIMGTCNRQLLCWYNMLNKISGSEFLLGWYKSTHSSFE